MIDMILHCLIHAHGVEAPVEGSEMSMLRDGASRFSSGLTGSAPSLSESTTQRLVNPLPNISRDVCLRDGAFLFIKFKFGLVNLTMPVPGKTQDTF